MQSQSPIYIGVQEPVETYTPSNGSKWIVIKGRLMNGTGEDVTVVQWRVIVKASNGQTVFDQDLTPLVDYTPSILTNRNSSTTHSLVYNARLSNDFTTGTVTQQVRLTLNGQPYLLLRNSPVTLVEVAGDLQFPLLGLWRLTNAPDSSATTPPLHLFEADLNRYAFDIVKLQVANGPAFSGDPGVNESYFGWNQPIYAMEDGTVLYVLNTTPDNDGNLQNKSFNMNANAVIMQNTAGQYDLFFHFRQGSIVVNVGQAITRGTLLGRVGNSGLSTLPHLHVQSYALDSTGFAKSLAQSFLNLQTIQAAHVTGIPATGVYQAHSKSPSDPLQRPSAPG